MKENTNENKCGYNRLAYLPLMAVGGAGLGWAISILPEFKPFQEAAEYISENSEYFIGVSVNLSALALTTYGVVKYTPLIKFIDDFVDDYKNLKYVQKMIKNGRTTPYDTKHLRTSPK